jgi:type IV secretion system protein VirB9
VIRHGLLAVFLFGAAMPLAAQVRPMPGDGDPRLRVVDYREGQVVLLELAPGYQMMVEFAPDEQIENVAVGDTAAWQVSANRRGDRLFVKALQGGVPTNMTVVTNTRLYTMELAPLSGPDAGMAYVVSFRYGETPGKVEPSGSAQAEGRYRLDGDRDLRPSAISDDGKRTYIQWPAGAAAPAVYAAGADGREILINGTMRDDILVIDAVVPRLVFRGDRNSAEAVRLPAEESR